MLKALDDAVQMLENEEGRAIAKTSGTRDMLDLISVSAGFSRELITWGKNRLQIPDFIVFEDRLNNSLKRVLPGSQPNESKNSGIGIEYEYINIKGDKKSADGVKHTVFKL